MFSNVVSHARNVTVRELLSLDNTYKVAKSSSMKHIKVFNLTSGNERVITTFEYFKNRVTAEMSDAYETVKKHPNLGTVKDGSRLKYAQEFDYILNNVLVESENWEDIILSYIEKRKAEINAFIGKLPIDDCVDRCIGLRQANSFCENIIYALGKYIN